MAYMTMKMLIANANGKYETGLWTKDEYTEYKELQQPKLDVFYANGRLTEAQYEELTHMWADTDE